MRPTGGLKAKSSEHCLSLSPSLSLPSLYPSTPSLTLPHPLSIPSLLPLSPSPPSFSLCVSPQSGTSLHQNPPSISLQSHKLWYLVFLFNWSHFHVFSLKSKFSQNTTNLLSIINVATCFDSRSHHQANYWTMFVVHQLKVHILGIPKCLQQWETVGTIEVGITVIITTLKHIHVFIKNVLLWGTHGYVLM